MAAHTAPAPTPHPHASEHAHPTPGTYFKIAVVLFILTAFEVLTFEAGRGGLGPTLRPIFEPIVVLVLVVFSGAKFVLVAMFYMHLKQDPRLLSNLFAFPLTIAAIIIAALIVLFRYWRMMGAL
jgi:cytochrome c oxidase subunit 4